MTKTDYHQEAAALTACIQSMLSDHGADTAEKMHDAASLVLEWIGYLAQSKVTGNSDHFLDGLRSLVLEAAASAASGLHRSAMFSMRAQIDVTLSWLYFKDHPVEWEKVERENEGYKLKKDASDYLASFFVNFNQRLLLLTKFPSRQIIDPYKILSAHIHSTGKYTVPNLTKFSDVVGDKAFNDQLVAIQFSVSEYISDIFIAAYGSSWASIPNEILITAKSRVPAEQQHILFG
ncbi:MAG: hypothetical protein JWQ16_2064 [Novosphingobium sp.]|nr:hypothetical protein [Novosphingobium sp.]